MSEEQPLSRELFTGGWQKIAILGMRRGVHRWTQVGTQGHPPFKVTHAVYSIQLLNVEATMKAGVRYAPYPVLEDIDFNFACEGKGLVVLKCNTLFYTKINLQSLTPSLGAKAPSLQLMISRASAHPLSVLGGQAAAFHVSLPESMQVCPSSSVCC